MESTVVQTFTPSAWSVTAVPPVVRTSSHKSIASSLCHLVYNTGIWRVAQTIPQGRLGAEGTGGFRRGLVLSLHPRGVGKDERKRRGKELIA